MLRVEIHRSTPVDTISRMRRQAIQQGRSEVRDAKEVVSRENAAGGPCLHSEWGSTGRREKKSGAMTGDERQQHGCGEHQHDARPDTPDERNLARATACQSHEGEDDIEK